VVETRGLCMGHDRLNPRTRVYFSFVELALVCEHVLTDSTGLL
jgi:hypothetical protein